MMERELCTAALPQRSRSFVGLRCFGLLPAGIFRVRIVILRISDSLVSDSPALHFPGDALLPDGHRKAGRGNSLTGRNQAEGNESRLRRV